jgi:ParB-like chromosome segregation protein Spo0J
MSQLIPLEVTDKIEIISVHKLILNELSLKTYSTPNNYEEILENIREKNIIQPIIVNEDYRVISGTLRVLIARELNFEVVPVWVQKLSDEEMDLVFMSSNFQREKSLADKYRENNLINSLFGVRKGSRTDLNPQLKEEKQKKDELKKGLSTYEVNSFNRINKLAKEQFGDNFKEVMVEELKQLEQSGKSLNTLVGKLEKTKQKVRVKPTPKPQPTKVQVTQQIKKVLNQLPVEQHKEVLESLLQQYDFQMVG